MFQEKCKRNNKFDLMKMKIEKHTSIHQKYQNWNTNKENFYKYHRWGIYDMKTLYPNLWKKFKL